jgi:hypothetical protein
LRGWNHNPATKEKIWYFVHYEERCEDKQLHCTINISEAKCFAVSKETKFYDLSKVPKDQTKRRK